MHVAIAGELQFTVYGLSVVVPRLRLNVTGAQPSPVWTSVIVVVVMPAPDCLQLLVSSGATSDSTRPPVALTAKVAASSIVLAPTLTTTPFCGAPEASVAATPLIAPLRSIDTS